MGLTTFEMSDKDLIILEDATHLSGTHAAVGQDKISLQDLEFDDDEVMEIHQIAIIAMSTTAWSNINTAADYVSAALTLFKTATAGTWTADDVPIWIEYVYSPATAAAAQNNAIHKFRNDLQSPVIVFDHFYVHNFWKGGGADVSNVFGIAIWYKKKKMTDSDLRDAIKLLRMAG